jgi:hypothetical protein
VVLNVLDNVARPARGVAAQRRQPFEKREIAAPFPGTLE